MAEQRARHAFGALENIDKALAKGDIDSFDILFVKDANGKPFVGWIDKEGNKIICQEEEKVIVVEGESLPETGAEGKIYIFGEDGYFWNGTEFVNLCKPTDVTSLETQVADLGTEMKQKVDAATVETMIKEYSDSLIEVVEF
jgi:hypothetical protein